MRLPQFINKKDFVSASKNANDSELDRRKNRRGFGLSLYSVLPTTPKHRSICFSEPREE